MLNLVPERRQRLVQSLWLNGLMYYTLSRNKGCWGQAREQSTPTHERNTLKPAVCECERRKALELLNPEPKTPTATTLGHKS